MTHVRRTFTLHIQPDQEGGYGVALEVAANGNPGTMARLDGPRLDKLRPSVLAAVTASRHARTTLSATRRAPIALTEEAGVRLALVALATAPLTKPARVDAIRHGVDAMTDEEALYWYALCTGPNENRARKALRTLLAEE